jgi:predicted RNA-binding Zn-ribbon protein involved in translation (DUF1610 family)
MGEQPEPKITYDSTPWHVCPQTGEQGPLRFKGSAREGREVACPACGQRFVYKKPGRSSTATEQGGRTHF